jgi:hypothetical protein
MEERRLGWGSTIAVCAIILGLGLQILVTVGAYWFPDRSPIGLMVCFSPGAAIAVLGAAYLVAERYHKRKLQDMGKFYNLAIEHHEESYRQKEQDLEASHRAAIRRLESAKVDELNELAREEWLHKLRDRPWLDKAREIEVEVKLVFPLLRHLGYRDHEMALRVPVPMQEGSSQTTREADWVVSDDEGGLLVVEAKAPDKELGQTVANQARSYASNLGVPVYIITNGKRLEVYHRGVIQDRCVFSCAVRQLSENWDALWEVASRREVTGLKDRLT